MKREGSAPELGHAARGERPRTEEFDAADADDRGGDDARPRAIREAMQTAEIDVARDRRPTLTSPIPAFMADSMVRERIVTPAAAGSRRPRAEARRAHAPRRRFRPGQRRLRTDDAVGIRSGRRPLAPAGCPAHRRRARRLRRGRSGGGGGRRRGGPAGGGRSAAARHRRGDRTGAPAADPRVRDLRRPDHRPADAGAPRR